MPKEKDITSLKDGISKIQSKVASGEIKVSQSLLTIFNIFSETDEENFKKEAEMLKKYHPEEYKEYLALLKQMKQKEKPVQSVEEQKKLLMEDALILWKTESYPRKNFNKDPLGEKHEKENKAAHKEFEEVFNRLYQDKKIAFGNKEAVYGGISFNANYNNYGVLFLWHERGGDVGYPLRFRYAGGKVMIEPNSLSVSMDMIDDESKNLLEDMFVPHCDSDIFKQYDQADHQQKISA